MPWDVRFHPEFTEELLGLPKEVRISLVSLVSLLADFGPTLGRPKVDALKGSKVANLKELRFDAAGGVWRVAFAFDGRRIAVLLAAGNKRGRAQQRFYKDLIAMAEQRWSTWR